MSEDELKATIDRYEDVFRRIAESVGVSTPLQLIAMAENDDDNYAELLATFIECKEKSESEPSK